MPWRLRHGFARGFEDLTPGRIAYCSLLVRTDRAFHLRVRVCVILCDDSEGEGGKLTERLRHNKYNFDIAWRRRLQVNSDNLSN